MALIKMEFDVGDWSVPSEASTLANTLFGGEKKGKSKKARKRAHAESLKSTQHSEAKASRERTGIDTSSPEKKQKTEDDESAESKKEQKGETDYLKQIFVVPESASSGKKVEKNLTNSNKKKKKNKKLLSSAEESAGESSQNVKGEGKQGNGGIDSVYSLKDGIGSKMNMKKEKKRKIQSSENPGEETADGDGPIEGCSLAKKRKNNVGKTTKVNTEKSVAKLQKISVDSVKSPSIERQTDENQKKKRKRKSKKNKFKDYGEDNKTTTTLDKKSQVNKTANEAESKRSSTLNNKASTLNNLSGSQTVDKESESKKTLKKLKKEKNKGKKMLDTENQPVQVAEVGKQLKESSSKKPNEKSDEVDEAALQLWKERRRLKRSENRKKKKLLKKQGGGKGNELQKEDGGDSDNSDDEYVEVMTESDVSNMKGKHKLSDASKKGSKASDDSKDKLSKNDSLKASNNKLSAKHNHRNNKTEESSNSDEDKDDVNEVKEIDKSPKPKSLLEKSRERLNAARFRYLNEQLYTTTGKEAFKLFKQDQQAFQVYHNGFQGQVEKWPTNPVDLIINQIKAKQKSFVVADFGCGDAKIARSVPNKVHSFDLVALNKHVTVCDMSKVPLADGCVDIAVFCLSLMGTNLGSYLQEANRVLKQGGSLLIAEVTSRFASVDTFIKQVENLGFSKRTQGGSNKMFVFLDFKKTRAAKAGDVEIVLKPCIYKKR